MADVIAVESALSAVVGALRAGRMRYTTEEQLHQAIAAALAAAGVGAGHEVRMGARDRPDFLADCGIAIEVKVDGSTREVTRQLARYAEHDEITALVLLTNRSRHRLVPRELNGKRVVVVHTFGGGL